MIWLSAKCASWKSRNRRNIQKRENLQPLNDSSSKYQFNNLISYLIVLNQSTNYNGYLSIYPEPEQKPNQEPKSFFTEDKQRYSFYFDINPEAMPEKVDVHIQAHILLEDVLPIAIDQVN